MDSSTLSPAANLERNLALYELSFHAQKRMGARGISRDAIAAAIEFGRLVHVRGARVFAIGRREVAKFQRCGIVLAQHEGIQVVCGGDGTVMTVYRNRDFRSLRQGKTCRRCPMVFSR